MPHRLVDGLHPYFRSREWETGRHCSEQTPRKVGAQSHGATAPNRCHASRAASDSIRRNPIEAGGFFVFAILDLESNRGGAT